ncbi:MAG: hypothetical protein R2771_14435 [Saprospiraceae bacterium]
MDVKTYREKAVISHLKQIRTSQEIYREITDTFAGNLDDLVSVLKTKSIPIPRIIGNPDDITNVKEIQYDTTYVSALDSLKNLNVNVDSMIYVPFSDNKKFSIEAGEIEYQNTKVNVVQVGTFFRDFMGPYADLRFEKYETGYSPDNMIKFGDLNAPNLTGNWE